MSTYELTYRQRGGIAIFFKSVEAYDIDNAMHVFYQETVNEGIEVEEITAVRKMR